VIAQLITALGVILAVTNLASLTQVSWWIVVGLILAGPVISLVTIGMTILLVYLVSR
jgi:hypothetical protein